MLSIIASGDISLDLPKDAVMEFNLENPAFSDDFLSGSYSQTITLPFTKTNDRFFNNARFIEVKRRTKTYDNVLVKYKNMLLYSGKLNLMRITDNGYEVSYSINGFILDVFGKKLKEVNYGSDYFLGNYQQEVLSAVKSIALQNYPAVNCNFPSVENYRFYQSDGLDLTTGSNDNYLGKINRYAVWASGFSPNYTSGAILYNANTLVPFLYIHFIIEKIFEDLGYTIQGEFLTDVDMQKLLLYNGNSLDRSELKPCAKIGQAAGIVRFDATIPHTYIQFTDETSPGYSDPNNMWNATFYWSMPALVDADVTFIVKITYDAHAYGGTGGVQETEIQMQKYDSIGGVILYHHDISSWVATASPGDVYEYVFQVQCNIGDYVDASLLIHSDFATTNDWIDISAATIEIADSYNNAGVNNYKSAIHYADHVPDMTITEFLKELCKIPGIYLTFDPIRKTVNFNFRKDIFSAKIIDLSASLLQGSREIKITNSGYKFSYNWGNDSAAENNFNSIDGYTLVNTVVTIRPSTPRPTAANQMLFETCNRRYFISQWSPAPINAWTWKFYTHKADNIIKGTGEKEITSMFSPVLMATEDYRVYGDVVNPKIEATGNSDVYNQNGNDSPLKLMFYFGFQTVNAETWPFASSHPVLPDGTMAHPYSLFWDDMAKGPYTLFWEKWVDFIVNADPAQLPLELSVPEIKKISHENRLAIWRDLFFWKKITTQIGDGGVEQTRTDLFQVKPQ